MLKLNAMKRFFKWMAVGVFIFFVAVIGLGFWLRHQYPPERIRRMAGDWLGARLGRQVEIADAKLSLLRGVELNGIRISEAPAFSAGTFIEARRVRVLPRILPLLSHQIIVRSIEVERPRATVRRSGEGLFNFSDLLSTGTVSETSGLTPRGPLASAKGSWSTFLISRATLSEGEITYVEEARSLTVVLHSLDARISGFSFTNPFGLKVKTDLNVRQGHSSWKGPLSFQARVSPLGDKRITFENVHLGLGDSSLELAGFLTPLPVPHANVSLKLISLAASDVAPFFSLPEPIKDLRLAGQWTIQISSSRVVADGSFDAQSASIGFSGSLKFETDGALHHMRLTPKSFRLEECPLAPNTSGEGPLSGQWDMVASRTQWKIRGDMAANGAVIAYGGWLNKPSASPLTLTASFEKNGTNVPPTVTADLRAPVLNITPGGPWPKDLHLSGKMGLTGELQGSLSDLAFDVSADGQSLDTAYGSSFRKPTERALTLSAAGRLKKKRDIELSVATIRAAASAFEVRGNVTDLMNTRSLNLDVKGTVSDLAQVGTILPPVTEYQLRGQTTIDASVNGPAENPSVEGRIQLSNAAATPVPGVTLSEVTGKIRFDRDTAEIESFSGKTFGSPFTLKGRIDHFDRPTIALDGRWDRMEVEKLLNVFSPATSPVPTNPASTLPTKNASPSPAPIAQTTGVFRIGEIVHPHYVGHDFQFKWAFANAGPNLSVLSGTATVTAATGEIKDVPVAKKINKLLNREGSDIAYKKLAGQFIVTQGVAEIPSFVLNSDQTDFSAHGRIRLGDMESDLRLMLKLPPGSVRGSVGNWITADDGRPTIEATLKGPLRDPKVKVDYSDTVRRAAKDILNKTLGGWKGKPDRPPATAP
jgi:hypothetical protein